MGLSSQDGAHHCRWPPCLLQLGFGCSPPSLPPPPPSEPMQHSKDISLSQALQDGHGVCLELHQRLTLTWAADLRLPSALLCVGGIWGCSGHAQQALLTPSPTQVPYPCSPFALTPSPASLPNPSLNPTSLFTTVGWDQGRITLAILALWKHPAQVGASDCPSQHHPDGCAVS